MRRVILLVVVLVVGLAVTLGLIWVSQRRLIYFPTAELVSVSHLIPNAESISFTTADGIELAGLFVRAPAGEAYPITIMVCNGNAGNRTHRAGLAARLSGEGYSVLLWDYRGYGGNLGYPTEDSLIIDAYAARDYLLSRNDVDSDRLVYYGESLGTAVAVALAASRPPRALVLRSPFSSLEDVARLHYPFLPVKLLLRDRWDSTTRVSGLRCPVLIVAGTTDQVVPPQSSRTLFDALPLNVRTFVSIPSSGHNDRALLDGDELIDSIVSFLVPAAERLP